MDIKMLVWFEKYLGVEKNREKGGGGGGVYKMEWVSYTEVNKMKRNMVFSLCT